MKILLLEDEIMLKNAIKEYLESLGHFVVDFTRGDEAKNAILKDGFDLLILDINVPKMNGFELLEAIKENKIFTPTIFVSAIIDIEEISKAFMLGAVDYIKKPFHLRELGLRLQRAIVANEAKEKCHITLSKNYCYSKEERALYFNGQLQPLTKRQLQILDLLCSNIGIIVDFDKLRSFVWNDEPIDNPTIRAEMSRLRKNFKEDFITNIKGVGYKIDKYIKI